ncbi:MAG: hypothetical protein IPK59_11955 [Rhodospirillaceae bacterium]|nr:hypothetical protein [Rhodospirillaceae bacterium]
MSLSVTGGSDSGSGRTSSLLAGWRACEAELRQKQESNAAARDRVIQQRQESALAASRGDADAGKRMADLASEEAVLHLAAQCLDLGLRAVAQEIDAEEMRAAAKARARAVKAHGAKLAKRIALVEEIEQRLRAVTPLLAQLATLTGEIERAHAALGGARPFLPPLAQEAVGGRLAEFMTGCGFAAWLPLARPEFRPALGSWAKAEREIQETYRLTA